MRNHRKKLLLLVYILLIVFSLPINAFAQKTFLTYLYGGTASMYTNYVDRAGGAIDIVCPDYLEINANTGDLKLLSKISSDFVDAMHKENIKVVPFLSNHWVQLTGQKALENRNALVAQIVSAVSQYGFDGINIDIENMTHEHRSIYTDFIRLLKESLPPDKTVSIAVAANPYGVYYGWAGSYDYQALGQLCDFIMIMTYDESWYGSPPGPVASASFVENSLKYALKNIPAEKILLGVPFYGRYWKEGAAKGGNGLTGYDVDSLINKYNGTMTYDTATQTAKVEVIIRDTDPKPIVWGGIELGAGKYTIYYDNADSLKYKLNMVNEYGILGAGSWCLGQESLDTWDYFDLWLNAKYFKDILGHFAEDDILSLYKKGWMIGTSASTFAPDRVLTRGEAAVIMVRALGLSGDTPAEAFPDTIQHSYRDMIGIARKYQIMLGDGNGLFWPDRPLTREHMAMILDRILVLPEPASDNPFSDINSIKNSLSYASIMRLSANGITKGNPSGTYQPERYVNRGEMAAFINRASIYEMTYPKIIDPNIDTPPAISEPR